MHCAAPGFPFMDLILRASPSRARASVSLLFVMAGLDPAIHGAVNKMDGPIKSGHDDCKGMGAVLCEWAT